MHSTIVHLYQGDGNSWAINLADDSDVVRRAQKGFGGELKKVWSLELQSEDEPDFKAVDWNAVLERAIYACDMNDPLISDFIWPQKKGVPV